MATGSKEKAERSGGVLGNLRNNLRGYFKKKDREPVPAAAPQQQQQPAPEAAPPQPPQPKGRARSSDAAAPPKVDMRAQIELLAKRIDGVSKRVDLLAQNDPEEATILKSQLSAAGIRSKIEGGIAPAVVMVNSVEESCDRQLKDLRTAVESRYQDEVLPLRRRAEDFFKTDKGALTEAARIEKEYKNQIEASQFTSAHLTVDALLKEYTTLLKVPSPKGHEEARLKEVQLAIDKAKRLAAERGAEIPQQILDSLVDWTKKAQSASGQSDLVTAHRCLDHVESLLGQLNQRLAAPSQQEIEEARKKSGAAAEEKRKEAQEMKHAYLSTKSAHVREQADKAFPKGTSDKYAKEKLKKDQTFQEVLAAMWLLEQNPRRDNIAQLESWIRTFQSHVQTLSEEERNSPDIVRKLEICAEAMRGAAHLSMKFDFDDIGQPPWTLTQEAQANGLHAKLLFEETGQPAKVLGGEGGASQSFWIEKFAHGEDIKSHQASTFIFKPQDGELAMGFPWPQGCSAAREAIAPAFNQQMQAMTGLDLGVCDSSLVKIDNEKLPVEGGVDPNKAPQRLGAMQSLAKNDGQISSYLNDPTFLATIPRKEIDKVAILSLSTLNLDRNEGNILVQKPADPNGAPTLVPIDQGWSMPSRDGYRANRQRIRKDILMSLPQAKEPMGEDALKALELVDPDQMVSEMKKQRDALEQAQPAVKGTITDESIEMNGKMLKFLKIAAPRMTLEELYEACAGQMDRIFDADDTNFERVCEQVIFDAKREVRDRDELRSTYTYNDRIRLLDELGWLIDFGFNTDTEQNYWINDNASKCLKILKRKQVNPAAIREINELTAKLPPLAVAKGLNKKKVPDRLKSLREAVKKFEQEQKNQDPALLQKVKIYGLDAAAMSPAELGKTLTKIEDYERFGGDGKLFQLGMKPDQLTFDERYAAYQQAYLKGGAAFDDEFAKAYPSEMDLITHYIQDGNIDSAHDYMKMWQEYKSLGGVKKFVELGGVFAAENRLDKDFPRLKQLLAQQQYPNIDAVDPQQMRKETVLARLGPTRDEALKYMDAKYRPLNGELRSKLEECLRSLDENNFDRCEELLDELAEGIEKAAKM